MPTVPETVANAILEAQGHFTDMDSDTCLNYFNDCNALLNYAARINPTSSATISLVAAQMQYAVDSGIERIWRATYFDINTQDANPAAQYAFTCNPANATVDATFTTNEQTFTVLDTIINGTLLLCTGTGAPQGSGILTLATGAGDATITFGSVANNVWFRDLQPTSIDELDESPDRWADLYGGSGGFSWRQSTPDKPRLFFLDGTNIAFLSPPDTTTGALVPGFPRVVIYTGGPVALLTSMGNLPALPMVADVFVYYACRKWALKYHRDEVMVFDTMYKDAQKSIMAYVNNREPRKKTRLEIRYPKIRAR